MNKTFFSREEQINEKKENHILKQVINKKTINILIQELNNNEKYLTTKLNSKTSTQTSIILNNKKENKENINVNSIKNDDNELSIIIEKIYDKLKHKIKYLKNSKIILNEKYLNLNNLHLIQRNTLNQIPYEYLNDIWLNFINEEKYHNYNYEKILKIQTDINSKMRSILINWLISSQNLFYKKKSTLFLTINIIDRYISNKKILRNQFQLLGIASLFISFKCEELLFRNINEFLTLTNNAFSKKELLKMENEILNILKFEIALPLSYDFFQILSVKYEFSNIENEFGYFLLEIFLLDININKYYQSEIALSVCYIILSLRKINENNEKFFLVYFNDKYNIDNNLWKNFNNIQNCAKNIYYYLENMNNIPYKAIFKVFDI